MFRLIFTIFILWSSASLADETFEPIPGVTVEQARTYDADKGQPTKLEFRIENASSEVMKLTEISTHAGTKPVHVYKSPTCGCCSAWIEHLEQANFSVTAKDVDQDVLWAIKEKAGITSELSSCHTAFVGGYLVECHVPASDVKRLLAERPDAIGLTVPEMPVGSPGMEMGDRRDPYNTLLVLKDGSTELFQRHF